MVETQEAIGNIEDLLAVEGIDVFFIGPGDLSQNMGYPPAPPFGQPRPQAVIDTVGFTVDKIRAAGKIAGTLVRSIEGQLKGSPAGGGRRWPATISGLQQWYKSKFYRELSDILTMASDAG